MHLSAAAPPRRGGSPAGEPRNIGETLRALAQFLATLATLSVLAACGRPPLHQQEAYVFGTRVEVSVAGADEATARAALAAVLQEFDRLHRLLHAWKPSEITSLNAAIAAGRPQRVSPEVAAILGDARRIAAAGEYLFDPGIGQLVRLWGFHADEFVARLPDAAAIDAWLASRPSIADLDLADGEVKSRKRDLAIDLGGYAKGYALDRAAAILRQRGINNALINIGGNVMALGDKNGKPWRIGIQHPREAGYLATLALFDGEAVGTSGDYQRFFEIDGARYSHLLDPRTGRPANGTQAVTVLLPAGPRAGTLSDAASKPIYLGGRGDWARLARQLGVTMALRVDADGSIAITQALAARLDFGSRRPALTILPP